MDRAQSAPQVPAHQTQRNYIRDVGRLATFLRRPPDTASVDDLRRFQIAQQEVGLGVPTMNAIVSALRFFFVHTIERPDLARRLVRLNHPRPLPDVLSAEEVGRLLGATVCLKHLAALLVAYGAGLRVAEVAALKVADVDSTRMLLRVERGKGGRDRNAMLSVDLMALYGMRGLTCTTLFGLLAITSLRIGEALGLDVRDLDADEIASLLAAPDRTTWVGRRDHLLLCVAVQTGLRASELIGLRGRDVVLGTGAHLRCLGKGRKERCTPLRKETAKALQTWLRERRVEPDRPLFPSVRGDPLSRDAEKDAAA